MGWFRSRIRCFGPLGSAAGARRDRPAQAGASPAREGAHSPAAPGYPFGSRSFPATVRRTPMLALLGLLLVIWLVCIVLGVVIKGLFWLVIVGAVLFLATAAVGFVKRAALGRGR
ncbi:predicted protein [Streptomyces sp. AA4]|nr:predicted protein [Streptomyces sp. AA4]